MGDQDSDEWNPDYWQHLDDASEEYRLSPVRNVRREEDGAHAHPVGLSTLNCFPRFQRESTTGCGRKNCLIEQRRPHPTTAISTYPSTLLGPDYCNHHPESAPTSSMSYAGNRTGPMGLCPYFVAPGTSAKSVPVSEICPSQAQEIGELNQRRFETVEGRYNDFASFCSKQ